MTQWTYKHNIIDKLPADCIGFVYEITNLLNGRKYIGKKLAKFTRSQSRIVKLKNGTKKKRRIKTQTDSDWQDYWGSSKELKQDILEYGVNNFRREILHFCSTKAICSYLEAKEQFISGALESDRYYNNAVMVRVHGNHIRNKI